MSDNPDRIPALVLEKPNSTTLVVQVEKPSYMKSLAPSAHSHLEVSTTTEKVVTSTALLVGQNITTGRMTLQQVGTEFVNILAESEEVTLRSMRTLFLCSFLPFLYCIIVWYRRWGLLFRPIPHSTYARIIY